MRAFGFVLLLALAGGCTSVKMVQRDGCWIRRTEKVFGRVREDIGPCTRPPPQWASDRFTRLVQECMAQVDYRWQGRAIDAWSKGRPYPAQPPQDEVLQSCMQEARVALVSENDVLKGRVAELSSDRSSLQHETEASRTALQKSNDRLAEFLGEAARKPTPPAYASATAMSDGKATNESGTTLSSGSRSGANGVPATTAATAPPSSEPRAAAPPVSDSRATAPPSSDSRASAERSDARKRQGRTHAAHSPRPKPGEPPARACDVNCAQQEAVAAPPNGQKPPN